MSLDNKLDFIVAAGGTKRYHTWPPTIKTQTVAEHSWRVAMLVNLIGPSFGMMIMGALEHDMAECKVGDLPAPGKRQPGFDRAGWNAMEHSVLEQNGYGIATNLLSTEERRIVKLCDNCEGALFCIDERMLGNLRIYEVFANFRSYIPEVLNPNHILEVELVAYIDRKWSEANVSK
jgi:5'-deoxynucleotidase YfbR-like HD superfamily hydrolase